LKYLPYGETVFHFRYHPLPRQSMRLQFICLLFLTSICHAQVPTTDAKKAGSFSDFYLSVEKQFRIIDSLRYTDGDSLESLNTRIAESLHLTLMNYKSAKGICGIRIRPVNVRALRASIRRMFLRIGNLKRDEK
jgi:hypothetical protein